MMVCAPFLLCTPCNCRSTKTPLPIPILTNSLVANIDQVDIDFLGAVNDIANEAETDVFDVVIADASRDELPHFNSTFPSKTIKIKGNGFKQNGKIKNKVLKLEATVLQLQIQATQGKDDFAKLATEQKKLDNNIALDAKAAGQASTKLLFNASTSP